MWFLAQKPFHSVELPDHFILFEFENWNNIF